jgi:hypothetical protein
MRRANGRAQLRLGKPTSTAEQPKEAAKRCAGLEMLGFFAEFAVESRMFRRPNHSEPGAAS